MSPPAMQFVHVAVCVPLVDEDAGNRSGARVHILYMHDNAQSN